MYHILIVGAGYTGSAIAEHYAGKKQKVWALTRNSARAEEFRAAGIRPVMADLTQPETLEDIPPAHFIVLCPAPDERSDDSYQKIYIEGIGNFLAARKNKQKPLLIVYLSSTGVWDAPMDGDVDETFLPEPKSAKAKILFAAERQVLMSGYPSVIFRLSGIYGPGRNRMQSLRQGQWPSENLGQYMNVIHRDDIVTGVETLFSKGKPGEVYLGVDDEPVAKYEFLSWLASKMKLETPDYLKDPVVAKRGKRCRNRKLKELGWQPKYRNFKEGYEALFKSEEVKI